MTFAVIKTGGKQYKVAANDVLKIEKLDAEAGTIVTFDQVLMIDGEVGAPLIEGALVAAELLETRKQKTVIIFKKNRRHNYRRRNGHRQLPKSLPRLPPRPQPPRLKQPRPRPRPPRRLQSLPPISPTTSS
jgi:ribosomal protein L21